MKKLCDPSSDSSSFPTRGLLLLSKYEITSASAVPFAYFPYEPDFNTPRGYLKAKVTRNKLRGPSQTPEPPGSLKHHWCHNTAMESWGSLIQGTQSLCKAGSVPARAHVARTIWLERSLPPKRTKLFPFLTQIEEVGTVVCTQMKSNSAHLADRKCSAAVQRNP